MNLKERRGMRVKHKTSEETLVHFQCSTCTKWWTIGDAPKDKKEWYCPWCGIKSKRGTKEELT